MSTEPTLPRWVYVLALLAVVTLAAVWFWPGDSEPTTTPPPPATAAPAATTSPASVPEPPTASANPLLEQDDNPRCNAQSLPPQAFDTIDDIESGGPYGFSRDGLVFENREGLLPPADFGYYHEYTVVTPGASGRGTRRIVTAGEDPGQADEVQAWWYTEDHYASFCRIGLD